MARQQFEVRERSAARPEQVWALLAEVEGWSRWGSFDEARLERPGDGEPQGVGAVRRFRAGKTVTRERVVGFDPPRHFAYTLLSGIPIRDYRADVTLAEAEGGTEIVWRSSFRPLIPGTGRPISRRLAAFVEDLARRLALAAMR